MYMIIFYSQSKDWYFVHDILCFICKENVFNVNDYLKYYFTKIPFKSMRPYMYKQSSFNPSQSLLVRNYFKFLVQQRFSNSNLRLILDSKSILFITKSNIASIHSFFSALCPSKLHTTGVSYF